MAKGIVMKGCKNGLVSNNTVTGAFDVGIEIEDCENIETSGNRVNVFTEPSQSRPTNSRKIGRNEKCPCGSGKKFKNCCGG